MIDLSNYGRQLELQAYKRIAESIEINEAEGRTALDDYNDLIQKKDNYYKNQYQQLITAIHTAVDADKTGPQNIVINHDDTTPMVMVNYTITAGDPAKVEIQKDAMKARPSGDAKTGGNPNVYAPIKVDANYKPRFIKSEDSQNKPTQPAAQGYEWKWDGFAMKGAQGWRETKITQPASISDRVANAAPLN
jgi:hypothetical protein